MKNKNHFKRANELFADGFRCATITPNQTFKTTGGKVFIVKLPSESSQVDRLVSNLTKEEKNRA
jgi:hypothetical protein